MFTLRPVVHVVEPLSAVTAATDIAVEKLVTATAPGEILAPAVAGMSRWITGAVVPRVTLVVLKNSSEHILELAL